jgi:hypothetical protein
MATGVIIDENSRDQRARNLDAKGFNGMQMVLVDLQPPLSPTMARLELFFYDTQHLDEILTDASAVPTGVFPIEGGHRVPAGLASGQVQVTKVAVGNSPQSLLLNVAPVGDYSTYKLSVIHSNIDPLFSTLSFKFRPGCFTTDCAPAWAPTLPREPEPLLDYLAKDYESFRHTMIAAMMQRVPGWQSTSEADLDQVIIDLVAAASDEVSDYQDRVVNEPYLARCRRRVSLARHARLMDYHLHQGSQASTWLALTVNTAFTLDRAFQFDPNFDTLAAFEVWTLAEDLPGVFFTSHEKASFDPRLNNLRFYTWNDAVPALAAGSTSADLVPDVTSPALADAQAVVDLIRGTDPATPPVTHLVIQEHLNPATGLLPGRNPKKRQLLRLLPGPSGAEVVQDPVDGASLVRVRWAAADALRADYCSTTFCPQAKVHDVSLFHGNLARVHEGRIRVTTFQEPDSVRPSDQPLHRYRYFQRTKRFDVLCPLPDSPLAYLPTPLGGEVPPHSTLHVEVQMQGAGSDPWMEVISLMHSDDSPEGGNHFAVEIDEHRKSVLRFGNGINGRFLATGAQVHCAYQVIGDAPGNAGFDSLIFFDRKRFTQIDVCWNPFDVTDGCYPEPVEKVVRAAPEAYRARQLRAVSPADYVKRAEEVDGVSHAYARYAWTGSWRTVRLTIDPVGTTTLSEDLRTRVSTYVDAVRLIGEDLEIRPPRYVPLELLLRLCINAAYWPQDLRYVLEQEFSDGYTPDGRRGFFHPDNWTFGQALHASELAGRIHRIVGIEHIISIVVQRFNEPTPGSPHIPIVEVGPDEIIQVHNDPDHLERGFIEFELKGGRQ